MILQLENVSLRREGNWILQDVNWQINRGENWVLFGLNGSGKTAILNLLNAYYFPTKGNVTVLGMEFGKTYLSVCANKLDLFHLHFRKNFIQEIMHLRLS